MKLNDSKYKVENIAKNQIYGGKKWLTTLNDSKYKVKHITKSQIYGGNA